MVINIEFEVFIALKEDYGPEDTFSKQFNMIQIFVMVLQHALKLLYFIKTLHSYKAKYEYTIFFVLFSLI